MDVNKKWINWLINGSSYRFSSPIVEYDDGRLTHCFYCVWANPGAAAILSLTNLIQLHMLRPDFDVNTMYTFKLSSGSEEADPRRAHLMTISMHQNDRATFDVLLAHPDINLNSLSIYYHPVRRLLQFAMMLDDETSDRKYFLRAIANHRTVDVNESLQYSDMTLTTMQWLIMHYSDTQYFPTSPRWALEILIEAGADETLDPSGHRRTPYYRAMTGAVLAANNSKDDEVARYLEALTVMREWPASMKINGLVRGFLVRRRLAGAAAAQE